MVYSLRIPPRPFNGFRDLNLQTDIHLIYIIILSLKISYIAGHTEIVDQLTMAGAELDMLDSDGKTALHLACGEGHYDVVVQLLR